MDVDEEEEGDTTQRLKKVPDHGIEVDFDILSANEREVSAFHAYLGPFLTYGTASASMQNSPSEVLGELETSITKRNAEIERMTPNMKAMDRHVFLFSYGEISGTLTALCLGSMTSRISSPRQKRKPIKPEKIPNLRGTRSTM
jgi:hypothetical protein